MGVQQLGDSSLGTGCNRGMRAMGSGSQCQDSGAKGAVWMGRGGSLGEAGSREGGSTGGPLLSTWRSGRAWRK